MLAEPSQVVCEADFCFRTIFFGESVPQKKTEAWIYRLCCILCRRSPVKQTRLGLWGKVGSLGKERKMFEKSFIWEIKKVWEIENIARRRDKLSRGWVWGDCDGMDSIHLSPFNHNSFPRSADGKIIGLLSFSGFPRWIILTNRLEPFY